ncbi:MULTISPECIES: HepT-like ribonuclease domain-containing protein [Raineya]|uniref:HepT-like ribonuclease domain-containing protein n=1 Tax=Raineya orbicola TaxID=2016530 RepID=UPI000C6D7DA5|nr:HepT-like ribonuclease domain-containing protein [Raineya orbicola]
MKTLRGQIIATRNRIIHGYDTVSCDIIWLIITKYLPILTQEIEQIMQELNKQ